MATTNNTTLSVSFRVPFVREVIEADEENGLILAFDNLDAQGTFLVIDFFEFSLPGSPSSALPDSPSSASEDLGTQVAKSLLALSLASGISSSGPKPPIDQFIDRFMAVSIPGYAESSGAQMLQKVVINNVVKFKLGWGRAYVYLAMWLKYTCSKFFSFDDTKGKMTSDDAIKEFFTQLEKCSVFTCHKNIFSTFMPQIHEVSNDEFHILHDLENNGLLRYWDPETQSYEPMDDSCIM